MKTKDILRGTMRFAWGTTLCITLFGLSSCNDFLEQEPPSNLTPEGFYTTEAQAQAVANQFYQDVMPHHQNWIYGWYTSDNNTDNQMDFSPDNKFGTGLWKTSNTNDNWNWNNVRNINYQLNKLVGNYKTGKLAGQDVNIRQYIGEIYFMRAYAYFELLKRFGDLPILTEALPDNEAILVAANKRYPRNEVARFIVFSNRA